MITRWLNSWNNNLSITHALESQSLQTTLMKQHRASLKVLLSDKAFMTALNSAYKKACKVRGEAISRDLVKEYIAASCWLCKLQHKHAAQPSASTVEKRSDLVKDLRNLQKAIVKLTRQVEQRLPEKAIELSYLNDRLQAGNPDGFIFNRKKARSSAIKPPQKSESIVELLSCLSSEVAEEAELLAITIAENRQKGGAQARNYLAMDTLTSASKRLSVADPAAPQFQLVACTIDALIPANNAVTISTLRRRYRSKIRAQTGT